MILPFLKKGSQQSREEGRYPGCPHHFPRCVILRHPPPITTTNAHTLRIQRVLKLLRRPTKFVSNHMSNSPSPGMHEPVETVQLIIPQTKVTTAAPNVQRLLHDFTEFRSHPQGLKQKGSCRRICLVESLFRDHEMSSRHSM